MREPPEVPQGGPLVTALCAVQWDATASRASARCDGMPHGIEGDARRERTDQQFGRRDRRVHSTIAGWLVDEHDVPACGDRVRVTVYVTDRQAIGRVQDRVQRDAAVPDRGRRA